MIAFLERHLGFREGRLDRLDQTVCPQRPAGIKRRRLARESKAAHQERRRRRLVPGRQDDRCRGFARDEAVRVAASQQSGPDDHTPPTSHRSGSCRRRRRSPCVGTALRAACVAPASSATTPPTRPCWMTRECGMQPRSDLALDICQDPGADPRTARVAPPRRCRRAPASAPVAIVRAPRRHPPLLSRAIIASVVPRPRHGVVQVRRHCPPASRHHADELGLLEVVDAATVSPHNSLRRSIRLPR